MNARISSSGRQPELGMSIALGAKEPIDRMVSIVQQAEILGVATTWVLDSQLLYRDAYLAMAVLARETNSMVLGPGVTNLVTRHPTVIANAMATLDSIAPGRVLVGIGTGDSSVRPLGKQPLRLSEFATGVESLRRLLAGEEATIDNNNVSITARMSTPPSIYVAATQPRMLRAAGAIADGVIILGPANPATVSMQMAQIDKGASDAGRDPAAIRRDLWVGLAIGEGKIPLDDIRSYASTQARILADWVDLPEVLRPFAADMRTAATTYDYRGHLRVKADHAKSVSDDFVRTVAIAGNKEECAKRLADLLALGLDRISITLLPGGRERRLEEAADLWESVTSSPMDGPRSHLADG